MDAEPLTPLLLLRMFEVFRRRLELLPVTCVQKHRHKHKRQKTQTKESVVKKMTAPANPNHFEKGQGAGCKVPLR